MKPYPGLRRDVDTSKSHDNVVDKALMNQTMTIHPLF